MFRSKSLWFVLSVLVIASMIISACAPAPTATPAAQQPTAAPQTAPTKAPEAKPTEAPPTPAPTAGPKKVEPKDATTMTSLTFAVDPETLDPQIVYENVGIGIDQNVYEGLIQWDGADPTKFRPLLAEAIPDPVKTDDGGLTYEWKIKDGVKFHNGEPLTAEDVAFSYWRSMLLGDPNSPSWLMTQAFFDLNDPAELVDASGALDGDPEALKKANAKTLEEACQKVKDAVTFDNDAHTVKMKLVHPWGPFLPTIAGGAWAMAVNKKWVAEQGDWDGDCKTWQNFYGIPTESGKLHDKAMGTGPYKLDHWTPGEEVVLVVNEDYWGGAPKIKRVVFKHVPEFGTRFAALQAGDADFIEIGSTADRTQMDTLVRDECNIDTNECKTVNPDGILRAYPGRPNVTRSDVVFNFEVPEDSPYIGSGKLDGEGVPRDFFKDVHIRRAFNYCFDYDTYIKDVQLGDAQRSLALTLPGQAGYDGSPIYEYDLAKCEEEFKAAELKSEDGKSVWDTGFYMQLAYNSGNTQRQAIAEILAENLQKVNPNFLVSPVALPWPLFLRTRGQFPMFTTGWFEDIHDPHNWYVPYLSQTGTFGNRAHIPAELADKYAPLIDQGVKETDPAKRAGIYSELNQLVHEDAPAIILSVANTKHYEPVYMKGWWGGLSQNLLAADYFYNELSKEGE